MRPYTQIQDKAETMSGANMLWLTIIKFAGLGSEPGIFPFIFQTLYHRATAAPDALAYLGTGCVTLTPASRPSGRSRGGAGRNSGAQRSGNVQKELYVSLAKLSENDLD